MPIPPQDHLELQAAVEQANAAIAAFLRKLPGGRAGTPEQRVVLAGLQGEWDAADRRLARARQGGAELAA